MSDVNFSEDTAIEIKQGKTQLQVKPQVHMTQQWSLRRHVSSCVTDEFKTVLN